jgi:hypothetical protein
MSTTTRAKIAAALRGRKHPHRGHALSATAKAKISAKLKRRRSSLTNPRRAQHASRYRTVVIKRRIKVGARLGFFHNETHVGLRHSNLFRSFYRTRSFFRSRTG